MVYMLTKNIPPSQSHLPSPLRERMNQPIAFVLRILNHLTAKQQSPEQVQLLNGETHAVKRKISFSKRIADFTNRQLFSHLICTLRNDFEGANSDFFQVGEKWFCKLGLETPKKWINIKKSPIQVGEKIILHHNYFLSFCNLRK